MHNTLLQHYALLEGMANALMIEAVFWISSPSDLFWSFWCREISDPIKASHPTFLTSLNQKRDTFSLEAPLI